jgi:peptidoglycan/LPS O-acetylase OafA/YrhL
MNNKTTLSSRTGHLGYLDGIRGAAALYVLIHHGTLQVTDSGDRSGFVTVFRSMFEYGRFAVDIFIVLSGFCLMLPVVRNGGVLKSGALDFYKRRSLRIVPTYYLATLLSLLLIFTVIGSKTGTNWDNSIPVTTRDIIMHLLLIQDASADTLFKINHTFWSVAVEFHLYFLFPLLIVGWRKVGAAATTSVAILLSLVLWFVLARLGLNVYGMAPHYLSLMAFGMLATQVSFGSFKKSQLLLVILCAIAAASLHPIIRTDLIVGASASCILYAVASGRMLFLQKFFAWRPLAFAGTFGYSIYLVHAPLLQLFSQFVIIPLKLSESASLFVFTAIACPAILVAAYLFFLVAEKPFIPKKNELIPAKRPVTSFFKKQLRPESVIV